MPSIWAMTSLIRSALLPKDLQVRAEDPYDDRLARAGENLVDPLVQVRLDVVEDARIPVDRLLERASVFS